MNCYQGRHSWQGPKSWTLPRFWVLINSYKKQPVKNNWGGILGLAWLKFTVVPLDLRKTAKVPKLQIKLTKGQLITSPKKQT